MGRLRSAQLTRVPAWALSLGIVAALWGCRGAGGPRAAAPGPERPSGCIDTPFIGGDHRATTTGVRCGREKSPEAQRLRGRVLGEELPGLPGPGLEGLWITSHPIGEGAAGPDGLPPAHAESRTGPQGMFSIALTGAREHVIAVRLDPGEPPLVARPIATGPEDPRTELVLSVPLDGPLRERLGLPPE